MTKKKLRKKIKALKGLVRCMDIHSGYPSCGYGQMTTEQKKLFCEIIKVDFEEYSKEFFAARR